MHPGPMNRGVEISTAVADGAQSLIREQVKWASPCAWRSRGAGAEAAERLSPGRRSVELLFELIFSALFEILFAAFAAGAEYAFYKTQKRAWMWIFGIAAIAVMIWWRARPSGRPGRWRAAGWPRSSISTGGCGGRGRSILKRG